MFARLRSSIRARLWQSWVSIGLVAGIVLSLAFSFQAASWCGDCEPHVASLILGALYGALLVSSRFQRRTLAGLNLLTSIGVSLLTVGRVLPTLSVFSSVPFADALWLMQVRILIVFDQLAGALLLPFLLGWLTWNASVWLVWCVARRRRAFEGVVPFAGLFALDVLLSGRDTAFPIGFIACAVLLVARTAYTERNHEWNTRRVDYPELIWESWLISASIIAGAVVTLAAFSTPEGRHSLQELIKLLTEPARPAEEQPALNPPLPGIAFAALVPDLRRVGAPISQSEETVMWVRVSDPPPLFYAQNAPTRTAPRHYWRGGIFSRYNGAGWEVEPLGAALDLREFPSEAPPGRYELRQEFEIVAFHGSDLYAVNRPVQASAGAVLRLNAPGDDVRLQGTESTYTVTSWATDATVAQLISDTLDYPPEILATYLQLPDSLPQRVRNLAARITSNAGSPYEKAVRIQDYLRLSYPYQLDVAPPPRDADVVDYFLFEATGGFCSYYASAMAVMLRAEGIPARVVTGFAMGEYITTRNAYRVPASAAHAWVEVYFPHYGWVEFEPTASQAPFVYQAAELPVAEATPTVQAPAATVPPGLAIALGIAALLGLFVLVRLGLRVRWSLNPAQRGRGSPAHNLYWQMRGALSGVGLGAPDAVTPGEFLDTWAGNLAEQKRLRAALQHITALYIRAVYSPRPPTRAEVGASRKVWRDALPDRLRLRLHTLPTRLKHRSRPR
ncbi:MAG TPA: transglutaminase domain-containing protein [Anaerolineae bacterium]|nr:transglutaminase domain-containing protein [Anaerolineae bacterium]